MNEILTNLIEYLKECNLLNLNTYISLPTPTTDFKEIVFLSCVRNNSSTYEISDQFCIVEIENRNIFSHKILSEETNLTYYKCAQINENEYNKSVEEIFSDYEVIREAFYNNENPVVIKNRFYNNMLKIIPFEIIDIYKAVNEPFWQWIYDDK